MTNDLRLQLVELAKEIKTEIVSAEKQMRVMSEEEYRDVCDNIKSTVNHILKILENL